MRYLMSCKHISIVVLRKKRGGKSGSKTNCAYRFAIL